MPTIPDYDSPIITPSTDLEAFADDPALDAETALLLAARYRLRKYMIKDMKSTDINIEHDEFAHPIAGRAGILIVSDGVTPGPEHGGGGTTVVEQFGLICTVIYRTTDIPRDRWSDLFSDVDHYLAFNVTLNQQIARLRALIDFDYDLINHATNILAANGDAKQGFEHPFIWTHQDKRPRSIDPEVFSASNRSSAKTEKSAGIGKSVYFGRCQRYTVRENFKTVAEV